MGEESLKVLVIGATGSIGRLVVEVALSQGYQVRALARSKDKARRLPNQAELAIGDLTRPETLVAATQDVDAIVFTHGSDGYGKEGSEDIDYGGVRNIVAALAGRKVRIALMTSIGVTNRNSSYNRSTEAHDWKRRSERLIRMSGLPYTIVRPGWFDCNSADEQKLVFRQGDLHHTGTPKDGAVARMQIARVLVTSLTSESAKNKTFELVTSKGTEQPDLNPLFAELKSDQSNGLDGILDAPNMPIDEEPKRVLDALRTMPEFTVRQSGGAR